MTLAELAIKRDAILATIGVVRASKGDRSVEYSKSQDALAIIDAEIARVNTAAGSTTGRTSYIQHSRE
jgi:hypothetical protein